MQYSVVDMPHLTKIHSLKKSTTLFKCFLILAKITFFYLPPDCLQPTQHFHV